MKLLFSYLIPYFFCLCFYVMIISYINEDEFKFKRLAKAINYFFVILFLISLITFIFNLIIFESCYRDAFACDLENMFGGIIVGAIRSLMVFCFPTFFYFHYFF